MYCPKCSQIQAEDGLRFCSRCGFQLGVVKELLAERDSAQVITAGSPPKFFSRRKQDLLFGATVMSVAATIVVQLSWAPKAAIIFPLWMIWLGFSLFVLSFDVLVRVARRLFSDDDHVSDPRSLSTSELPPMQNLPVTALGFDRVNTGEIRQPLSVTDHTTNLLNKK